MKKPTMKLWSLLMAIMALLPSFGCSSKEDPQPPKVDEKLEIASTDLNHELDRGAGKIEIPVVTNLEIGKWKVEQTDKWLAATKKWIDESHSVINVTVYENTTGEKRVAKLNVVTESKLFSKTITITQYGKNEVVVDEDVKISPKSGKASEYQDESQNIQKSFDGDFESHFHSRWNGQTRFPVTLEYYFSGKDAVDYVIYHTRNGNGNFGKVTVYAAVDEGHTYEKVGDYDFGEKSSPSVVKIPGNIKPTAIKFEVNSGLGGYASCAEMEFYQTNTSKALENKLLEVFTDATCSEVKAGVTDEQIANLGDYFGRVARAIRDNSYDEHEKQFRIRSYEAYSQNVEWANRLITNKYSHLDNPTGISVKAGDEVIVCVGDTYGTDISIECLWEENVSHQNGNYRQTASSGTSYMLHSGINKLTMTGEGQLFVVYQSADPTNAKPVKIHIPLGSGTATGFFDLKEHATDEKYAELLSKASHKYFAVRGERMIFYFHRTKMPSKILSAIDLWDNIMKWEQELCGIDKYFGKGFNNHIFAISPEANNGQMYMWASDYRIAFVYNYLNNILLKDNVMANADNAWGPAHEIGHCHQKAVNWASCTESSNNLFSNYVIYKLEKYGSRGSGLLELARARAEANDGMVTWNDIASKGYGDVHNRIWWQLWNYYHRLGKKSDFWPEVYESMREKRVDNSDPGRKMLEFAKSCCDVSGEDLSEFFELWGFFTPLNVEMSDYGNYTYKVTDAMINEAKEYMAQYPKQKQPFQYIEDRKKAGWPSGQYDPAEIGDLGFFETFKNNPALSSSIAAKVSGRHVAVSDGNEAVAIEIRKTNESGKILYFSNFLEFDIPSAVDVKGCVVCAVQADGTRRKLASI